MIFLYLEKVKSKFSQFIKQFNDDKDDVHKAS